MTAPSAPAQTAPKTNLLALIGFIAAFIIPLLGIILCVLGRRQLDVPGNTEEGRGLARWGMVIGALGLTAEIIFMIIWVSMFVTLTSGGHIGR